MKLDIMLNSEIVDALSFVVHKDKAYTRAQDRGKLKEAIPRHQFSTDTGMYRRQDHSKETVKAYRKDVLSKCYGGDITRKKSSLAEGGQEADAPAGYRGGAAGGVHERTEAGLSGQGRRQGGLSGLGGRQSD